MSLGKGETLSHVLIKNNVKGSLRNDASLFFKSNDLKKSFRKFWFGNVTGFRRSVESFEVCVQTYSAGNNHLTRRQYIYSRKEARCCVLRGMIIEVGLTGMAWNLKKSYFLSLLNKVEMCTQSELFVRKRLQHHRGFRKFWFGNVTGCSWSFFTRVFTTCHRRNVSTFYSLSYISLADNQ